MGVQEVEALSLDLTKMEDGVEWVLMWVSKDGERHRYLSENETEMLKPTR
jgi:hypothetical protein